MVRTGAGDDALRRARRLVDEAADLLARDHRDPAWREGYNPVTGRLNPYAAPLAVKVSPDGVIAGAVTLGAVHEGPPGHVHGGIVSLLLDQVLGHAVAAVGEPGMTASLTVHYRRPTPIDTPLTVTARCTGARGRRVFAEGTIEADGVVTADATGVFVRVAGLVSSPTARTADTASARRPA